MAKPGKSSVPTGWASEIVLSESTFRANHRTVSTQVSAKAGQKRKREGKGDSSSVYGASAYKGPWAKFEASEPSDSESEYEEVTDNGTDNEEDEPKEMALVGVGKQGDKLPKLATDYMPEEVGETSEFLGSEEFDYMGRTYMHIPRDLNIDLTSDLPDDYRNYLPNKTIHTWKHQSGAAITKLEFFPGSGHLLLSASASGKVMLYDMFRHNREALRSYNGHTKSVNDVCFSPDGIEFLTASYDRKMKLWDTETGKCKSTYQSESKATPHCIKFNPSKPQEFLTGMSDKKIVQFDTRTKEVVQEYDHHLGPVNTITFCDEDRRFITTSDDRSLRAWEYGIPVPIKYVAEADMFSMNRAASHPRKPFAAFQSQDNQIVVYSTNEKFRQNRKKGFRGHNNAGYGIDLAFSTDGEFLMSGDQGGYVCWWSWKTCKMVHKEKASDVPVVACAWHPRETSRVVTGDLNGLIKYWGS